MKGGPGRPRGLSGFIYALRLGNNVKIGWSTDPHRRLNQLRRKWGGACELVGVMPGTEKQEHALHRKYRLRQVNSEWFASSPEVEAFITTLDAPPPAPEIKSGIGWKRVVASDAAVVALVAGGAKQGDVAKAVGVRGQSISRVIAREPVRPPVAGAAQADDCRYSSPAVVRTYSQTRRLHAGMVHRFAGLWGTQHERCKGGGPQFHPRLRRYSPRNRYPGHQASPGAVAGTLVLGPGASQPIPLMRHRRVNAPPRRGLADGSELRRNTVASTRRLGIVAVRQFPHDALHNRVDALESHSRISKSVSRALSAKTRAATPNDNMPSVLQHNVGERDGRKAIH